MVREQRKATAPKSNSKVQDNSIMIEVLIYSVAVFLGGLLAGIFVGSGLVEHAVSSLPAISWVRYRQAKERVFGRVMPPMLFAAILASAIGAILTTHRAALGCATLLLVAVLAVTLKIHLPLNHAIDAYLPEAPPDDWGTARTSWRRWHWVRTVLAVAAFAVTAGALRTV
jgi:uncharacterized membrane protein